MGLKYWWRLFLIVFVAELAFHGFTFAEKAPNFSFIGEATAAPAVSYYDYIVVGGGTAGCPLAATLSQNANVLVLERGGSPYVNTTKLRIENFITTLIDSSPNSLSQPFISEEGVRNRRARALGGGTVINAGFYSRAEALFIKENGLDEALVRDSYEWVERKLVYRPAMLRQWQSALRGGLLEAGVLPFNGFTYDHINGTKIGGTIFDRDGNRHTAADLLEYADPSQIKVYLHALVNKIIFTKGGSRPRAQGVIFYDANGGKHSALLKNDGKSEIILSAGAIGSPQLLLLSGIGPWSKLEQLGIEVVLNQTYVGQDIADNPASGLFIRSRTPLEISTTEIVGISRFGHYIESSSGYDYSAVAPAQAGQSSMVNASSSNIGSIIEKISRVMSKGYVELRSTNVSETPRVRFNYYQAPEDLRNCVRGMETLIKIVNSKSFATIRPRNMTAQDVLNMNNLNSTSTVSLEQYCLKTIQTLWHYHGSCRVGKVVDGDYKVIGVDGLRVMDTSIFNFSPGTNPQATIMMLARYMGQRILQSRRR